jgi:O-antigen/teichoic acid export membrane protein
MVPPMGLHAARGIARIRTDLVSTYSASARTHVARLIVRVRESQFASKIAMLSGASAAASIVALGATPFISRLYTPSEYGIFGVFAAALSLVSVVASLRYDLGIPATADDEEAASILVVALCAVLVTSAMCRLLVMTGVVGILMPAARDSAPILSWALPLGVAAIGAYNTLASWMVRRGDYATLGKTKISQVAATVAGQLGLGLLKFGAVGLIIGQIAGSSMGILRLLRRLLTVDRAAFANLRASTLGTTAWRYRRFPMLSGPAVLLDAFTGALPLLALASRFGAPSAGVFTIVQRVLLAPLALVTISLGQVIFGDLATLHRANSATMMVVFEQRLKQITLVGVAISAVMVVFVPLLLPTVLGPQWGEATRYFLIILPMVLAGFISSPFGFAVDVLRRQDLHFIRDTLRTGVMVASLGIAQWLELGSHATLGMISVAGCINGVIYLGISWYAISRVKQPVSIAINRDVALGPIE